MNLNALFIWYKPETLIGSDGDEISVWTDSSGNGHHAGQGLAGKPLLTNSVAFANNYNGAWFTSRGLVSAGFNLITNFTVHMAYRSRNTTQVAHQAWDSTNSDVPDRAYAYDSNLTNFFVGVDAGIGGNILTRNYSNRMMTVVFSGVNSVIYTNGIACFSGNVGLARLNGFAIGAAYDGITSRLKDFIFEVIVQNSVATAPEILAVSNYFKTKFAW